MTLSLKYVTPLLLAAAAVACSSSENSPGGGKGGSSQVAKGGNAGANTAAGGTGTANGGTTNNPQGGGGGSGNNSNSGGSTQGGGSNNNSGGRDSSAGGSTQGGGSNNNSGGQNSNSGGSTQGGGSNSSGGAGVAGANTSGATDLKCNDGVYGPVSIPAAAVISDFETNTLQQYVQDGRGDKAEPWYAYAVDDVNTSTGELMTPSPVNPKNSANKFAVETTEHGPCSTKGALHFTSPGKADEAAYAGIGIDFMARTSSRKKLSYDASKYTGVGFWAKCKNDLQFAFFKTPDAKQDADMDPAPCSYSTDPKCNQYGIKNAVITNQWTYYKLYFSELLQDPNGSNFGTGVDKSKLTAFQIHVNPFRPRDGSPKANAFDCYIDDVHFLTEAAPTTPAATVTWTTDGNKLKRNGSEYRIRGLVRPSMEWDYAGFGVTREDVQRMKKWHANAVRLAVKDTLWNGDSKGNGPAYQRNVKRVINWIIQQGMDVILDYHYVGGDPSSSQGATFWDTVSKDAFFKDTRIIYELYNEPTGDPSAVKSWMQSTASKIRANGNKNLLLVSGVDWTYDIAIYGTSPLSSDVAPVAYVTHPYHWKTDDQNKFLNTAAKVPVIATEFGDAKIDSHDTPPTKCEGNIYSDYISKFETAGMSWTSWAWIVDEWGCGFPQIISNYNGDPNAIGMPVHDKLVQLNP